MKRYSLATLVILALILFVNRFKLILNHYLCVKASIKSTFTN